MFAEQPPPQSPGIGLAGMADPAHYALPRLLEGNLLPGVLLLQLAQAAAEAPDVVLDQQPVCPKDSVTQEADAVGDGEHFGLGRVQAQS